jgi:tripartite-type tricarboxylate transporter receptor subunit TctC
LSTDPRPGTLLRCGKLPRPEGTARLFAEKLPQKWGQPVVVENRQGADGILAVQSFLSDRDNHSLIFGFGGRVYIRCQRPLPAGSERS